MRFSAAFLESISAGWMIRQWDWRRERLDLGLHPARVCLNYESDVALKKLMDIELRGTPKVVW